MVERRGTTASYQPVVLQRPGEDGVRNDGRFRAQLAQQVAEISLQMTVLQASIAALDARIATLEGP